LTVPEKPQSIHSEHHSSDGESTSSSYGSYSSAMNSNDLNSYFNQPSNPMVYWPEVTVTGEWRDNAKPMIIFKGKPIIINGTTTTHQQQQKQ
jgi:hypothetical protein